MDQTSLGGVDRNTGLHTAIMGQTTSFGGVDKTPVSTHRYYEANIKSWWSRQNTDLHTDIMGQTTSFAGVDKTLVSTQTL